ncbi:MAG: hypothetical protein ACRYGP_02205 [Janthinobacterium lividum]
MSPDLAEIGPDAAAQFDETRVTPQPHHILDPAAHHPSPQFMFCSKEKSGRSEGATTVDSGERCQEHAARLLEIVKAIAADA